MRRAVLAALLSITFAATSSAQINNQVIVFAKDGLVGGAVYLRFDRRLDLLSSVNVFQQAGGSLTATTPIAIDDQGRSWIALDPLNTKQLLRLSPQGAITGTTWLSHNPANVAASADGRVFSVTRIPLLSSGAMYGVAPDGTILWSSFAGPSLFNFIYPRKMAITTTGDIWIGESTYLGAQPYFVPLITRIDPDNGDVLDTFEFPSIGGPETNGGLVGLMGAPDGTMWAHLSGGGDRALANTDGSSLLQLFPINGGTNVSSYQMRVDSSGRVYVLKFVGQEPGDLGDKLMRYNPASPATPELTLTFGGLIHGYAIGASGEDMFAVVGVFTDPFPRRLERMNLITGVKSSVPLDPTWFDGTIADGDPTGFIFANVVDRTGDNDGDGATNGDETAAGSNPFDASSRPEGPKVYISFTPSNAIELTYVDSDGLLDPTGGLDLTSLSLQADGYGEVFQYVFPFLSGVTVTPDGTSATATFGLLPVPNGLKIGLEASVADKTGAEGWDWQVTPPGDL